ncbi:hypothetical protein N8654_02215 [Synechococcus sp. AH-601-B19]|nr:hypothetical protein [Synechococcus sp. AH-601-B19]
MLASKHPLYVCWMNMKQRCLRTTHKSYHRYGGRGISVCQRWLDSFWNFVEDMGPKPSPLHSIEREDNDGNYTPDNCVWATKAEQTASQSVHGPAKGFAFGFRRTDRPMRFIRTRPTGTYQVHISLISGGNTISCNSHKRLEDAIAERTELEFERQMHFELGLR